MIGQQGEGNEASQSEEESQDSNENSMCVFGESTSLSCNNLSSESIGGVVDQGEQNPSGPSGPLPFEGTMYVVSGNEQFEISLTTANSTAKAIPEIV